MNNKLVSVIIPAYNAENVISTCIESVLKQSYKLIEIIIVNDGSTDATYEICEKYSMSYDYIKLVNKENEGVTIARLNGIYEANGDYISFIDADDWIDETYIETMMDSLKDADIVLAGIRKIVRNENDKNVIEKNNILSGLYETEYRLKQFYTNMFCIKKPFEFGVLPYMCNKIYKKDLLLPFMESVDKRIYDGEDVAVLFPYLLNAKKIVVSDYCGYNYLIHSNSTCHTKKIAAYQNASALYMWLFDCFNQSKYSEVLIPQLQAYFLMMVWKHNPGAFLETNAFVFPFEKVKKGKRIVVYGAGDVGQAILVQLKQTGYGELVAWVDKNAKGSRLFNSEIIAPQEIVCLDYDIVFVAIKSGYICQQVKKDLMKIGVEEKKIVLYSSGESDVLC